MFKGVVFSVFLYMFIDSGNGLPMGSRPARMDALPKLHKILDSLPALRPIITFRLITTS